MLDPLFRRKQRGSRRRHLGIVVARNEAPTRAGGQIDDQLGIDGTDEFDDLPVQLDFHRRAAGLRMAHMNVNDGGAGLRRFQCRRSDLLRRDGEARMLLRLCQVACHRTGNNGFTCMHDKSRLSSV